MRSCLGLLVLLAASGGQPGFTQDSTGSTHPGSGHVVTGYVRREYSNTPLSSAQLEILSSAGPAASTAFSGMDGAFRFDNLAVGEYYIIARLRGYDTVTVKLAVMQADRPNVIISLHKQSTEEARAPGDAISAHQLSVPEKAQKVFEKGRKLLEENAQPAKAIAQFQHAIEEYPSYYEAYAEIGVVNYRLKQFPAAEEALKKAVEMSSHTYPKALLLLAGLLNDEERFAEAEPVAAQAATIDDSGWQSHFELARALAGLKRGNEAETAAKKAYDLKPDNAPTLLVLANAHLLQQNYAAVVADLNGYLRLEPDAPGSEGIRQRRDRIQNTLLATPSHKVVSP